MKKNIILLLVTCCLAVTTHEAAHAAVKKYSSCKELNAKYPGGIARDASVQNLNKKGELQVSKYNPTVNAKIYKANKSRLDKDKDGIVCEK